MKWELFLPLAAHIGRGLVKPERLEVTGLPVQFKADDPLNFLESQCHRRLPAQAEDLPQVPVGVLQPADRLRDPIQQGEYIQAGRIPLLALDDHIIGTALVDIGQVGDGAPPAQNQLHQPDLLVRQHGPAAVMAAPGLPAPDAPPLGAADLLIVPPPLEPEVVALIQVRMEGEPDGLMLRDLQFGKAGHPHRFVVPQGKDMVPVLLIPIHILDRLPLPLGVELAHLLN